MLWVNFLLGIYTCTSFPHPRRCQAALSSFSPFRGRMLSKLKSHSWLQTVFLSWFSKLILSSYGLWWREGRLISLQSAVKKIFQFLEGEQRAQTGSLTNAALAKNSVPHVEQKQRNLGRWNDLQVWIKGISGNLCIHVIRHCAAT